MKTEDQKDWKAARDDANAKQKAERAALIEKHDLTLTAVFVPWSQSRNKGEERRSLNWKLTLQKSGRDVITTDYMQGVGHIPGYQMQPFKRKTLDEDKAEEIAAETGKYSSSKNRYLLKPLPAPSIEEVLYSLLMDADVIDYPTYEEWADNFGMDTDSRKGEKLYRDCLAIALKLRAALGEATMQQLREAYQDY